MRVDGTKIDDITIIRKLDGLGKSKVRLRMQNAE